MKIMAILGIFHVFYIIKQFYCLKVCISSLQAEHVDTQKIPDAIQKLYNMAITSDSIEIIPLYECCNVDGKKCILMDPCLTRSIEGIQGRSKPLYLGFARGTEIKIHPYLVFSSEKIIKNSEFYEMEFTDYDKNSQHIAVSLFLNKTLE
ncbi:hypothetical protein HZS_6112, partial [Henneguya salminicola]